MFLLLAEIVSVFSTGRDSYADQILWDHTVRVFKVKILEFIVLRLGWASLVAKMVKNLPAMQETPRYLPGSGRYPGGPDNPLQYSCLESLIYRGAWQATVHRFTKSQTEATEHTLLLLTSLFNQNYLSYLGASKKQVIVLAAIFLL